MTVTVAALGLHTSSFCERLPDNSARFIIATQLSTNIAWLPPEYSIRCTVNVKIINDKKVKQTTVEPRSHKSCVTEMRR